MKRFLIALAFIPTLAWSQITFYGTVKDAETQMPLSGATVLVPNLKLGTATDKNGSFRMEFKEEGMVGFKITFVGKEDLIESVSVKKGVNNHVFYLGKEDAVLQEVTVSAVRADANTPMTYTNIEAEDLQEVNYGQDVPFLLESSPSMVVTSDAGTGIGYTGLRLRGSDQTRINVTINGVPVNDAESQGVFWVDLPDLASSVESMQIQRGVGTSTHGPGAFGGSINISTFNLENKASAQSISSFGSFNTRRQTLSLNSGRLKGGFYFEGRLSRITSDGFIDRGSSDLNSYYLGAAWRGQKTQIRLTQFSGHERTYQAWGGVPAQYIQKDSARTFNPYTYENEVDDYGQTYNQLHLDHQFNANLKAKVALYTTLGAGFFEQYKGAAENPAFNYGSPETYADFGIDSIFIGDTVITEGDLIVRRWLDNVLNGALFSIDYERDRIQTTLGGGYSVYSGEHFGEIIWAQWAGNSQYEEVYYYNTARKSDGNVFLQTEYQPSNKLNIYADLQTRFVEYRFLGNDNDGSSLTRTEPLMFFNPKAGAFYQIKANQNLYASVGVAHKEPNRTDYTESTPQSQPSPEQLIDYEVGYQIRGGKFTVNTNFYYMDYNDQLVLTGELNDVGAATRVNVPDSYRAGIEVSGGYKASEKIRFEGNLTLSQNKISSFTEYLDDWDNGGQITVVHENTDIAFSPATIAYAAIRYQPNSNFELRLEEKYVGKQYLDNTMSDLRSLDAYAVTNLMLDYTTSEWFGKEIRVGFRAYNLLNSLYESNGWIYRFKSDGYNPVADDPYVTEGESSGLYQYMGYYPQAGTQFSGLVQIRF